MKSSEISEKLANGEYNPNYSYNAFKISFVSENLSSLLGEILTIVDASTHGPQNKAMKDLVRRAFSDKQEWFSELSRKLEEEDGNGHMPQEEWEDGLVPYDSKKSFSFKTF